MGAEIIQARDDRWELRVGGRELIRPRGPLQEHGNVIITEGWRLESGTTGPGPGEGWGLARWFSENYKCSQLTFQHPKFTSV